MKPYIWIVLIIGAIFFFSGCLLGRAEGGEAERQVTVREMVTFTFIVNGGMVMALGLIWMITFHVQTG